MPKVITPANKIKEVSDHIFNDKQSMIMLGFKPFVEAEPLPQPDPIINHVVKAEPATFAQDVYEEIPEEVKDFKLRTIAKKKAKAKTTKSK